MHFVTTTATANSTDATNQVPWARFVGYFLWLGTVGFGGPIALAGHMQQDLVDSRHWITKEDYVEGLALAQLAPGPLAAQLAMYLGYVRAGVAGATAVGIAFILPSFLMVLALSAAYVRYGGLSVDASLLLWHWRGGNWDHRALGIQVDQAHPGHGQTAISHLRGTGRVDCLDIPGNHLAISRRRRSRTHHQRHAPDACLQPEPPECSSLRSRFPETR